MAVVINLNRSTNTAEEDRRWLVEQFQYLYNRYPTRAELDAHAQRLQHEGVTRERWLAYAEGFGTHEAIDRIFQETLGRKPTARESQTYASQLAHGKRTRAQIREIIAGSSEAVLRPPQAPTATKDQEDAKAYLEETLRSYGLESLSGWAWEQIQKGHPPERILQELRQQEAYKQRFKGMEARRAAGLSAISEAEYLALERGYRQVLSSAGLPAGFYDSPNDYVKWIGGDVSVDEVQTRVNDGYLAATQAPAEVRAELQRLYGINPSKLAAYYLDTSKSLPLLQRQFEAAQLGGTSLRSGYGNLSLAEAERLASLDITPEQAQEGFTLLHDADELFDALPGEDAASITRSEQQAAAFQGDAAAREKFRRRASERVTAGSGAQSFRVGQGGVSGLSRDT